MIAKWDPHWSWSSDSFQLPTLSLKVFAMHMNADRRSSGSLSCVDLVKLEKDISLSCLSLQPLLQSLFWSDSWQWFIALTVVSRKWIKKMTKRMRTRKTSEESSSRALMRASALFYWYSVRHFIGSKGPPLGQQERERTESRVGPF